MNRYRRSFTQSQQATSQQSELSLGQSGAGPSMYFIDDSEPKRPNIISRGKIRLSTTGPSTTITASTSASVSHQHHQNQNQSPPQQLHLQTTQSQQLIEMAEAPTSLEQLNNSSTTASLQNIDDLIYPSTSTGTIVTTSSENEGLSLDAIPFHLLNDENTQTFLNSGQFETIETEDGNVLLILKEDIENNFAGITTNTLTFNSEILSTPSTSNSNYTIIENDVTTCTSSIESPISSVGINSSSVVQQQQEQIELQQPGLIQLAQQQLDTIDISDQIIVNSTEGTDSNQPQSYFLLQMSDGTSYLVPTDSLEGMPTIPSLSQIETAPDNSGAKLASPATKAKTIRPRYSPLKLNTTASPAAPIQVPASFNIHAGSQPPLPPPLVPTTKRQLTPSPMSSEQHKPYRFIMSEEAEEKRDPPLNPFIVKVLSEPPSSSTSRNLDEPVSNSVSPYLPKLISKAGRKTSPTAGASPSSSVSSQLSKSPKIEEVMADTTTFIVDADGIADLGNGLFKCSMCDKCTKLRINMLNHINRYHKGERPFKCNDCNETFQYPSGLRAHNHKFHVIKVFKCVPCTIDFESEADLKSHFTTVHAKEKNFVVVSSSSSSNNSTPSTLTPPSKVRFTCEHCKQQYYCKYNLLRHKVEHWNSESGRISCGECKQQFSSKQVYINHVQMHQDGCEYVCQICHKGFKSELQLTTHFEIHRKAPVEKVKLAVNPVNIQIQSSSTAKEASSEPLPTPKPARINQVFLCSRCDVIFTTSEALKAHFDVKHPHLIGKQQVILKSTRVPATYLENKLSQQEQTNSTNILPVPVVKDNTKVEVKVTPEIKPRIQATYSQSKLSSQEKASSKIILSTVKTNSNENEAKATLVNKPTKQEAQLENKLAQQKKTSSTSISSPVKASTEIEVVLTPQSKPRKQLLQQKKAKVNSPSISSADKASTKIDVKLTPKSTPQKPTQQEKVISSPVKGNIKTKTEKTKVVKVTPEIKSRKQEESDKSKSGVQPRVSQRQNKGKTTRNEEFEFNLDNDFDKVIVLKSQKLVDESQKNHRKRQLSAKETSVSPSPSPPPKIKKSDKITPSKTVAKSSSNGNGNQTPTTPEKVGKSSGGRVGTRAAGSRRK